MSLINLDSNTLPRDPAILASYLNTMLRDKYDNLDTLCDDLGIDSESLLQQMTLNGYTYNPTSKRFY